MEKKIAVSENLWEKRIKRLPKPRNVCIVGVTALVCIVGVTALFLMFLPRLFRGVVGLVTIFAALIVLLSILFLAFEAFARIMSKMELTVTNKRVYGKTTFGRRVDLPVDSISSIGMSAFHGIAIGTSSGRIVFFGISNRDELFDTINKLIVDRQQNRVSAADKQQNAAPNSLDDLKKLKELLDAGILTQEEFDAKKKKLLDL